MKNRIKLLCLLIALLVVSSCLLIACEKHDCEADGHKFANGVCKYCGKEEATGLPKADKPSLAIHYKRTDGNYDAWKYWMWVQGGGGQIYCHNATDDFGGIAYYALDEIGAGAATKGIGFIPISTATKEGSSWPSDAVKDCDADRLINFGDYELDENNYYHVYIKQGDVNLYMDAQFNLPELVRTAVFETTTSVKVTASANVTKLELLENGTSIATATGNGAKTMSVEFPAGSEADIGKAYTVKATFASGKVTTSGVSVNTLYTTDDFNAKYAYEGDDLGAVLSEDKSSTSFKVWSPVSQSIKLNLYSSGHIGIPYKTVDMQRGDKGVWYHTENDNLAGKYYTYTVTNSKYPEGREIVDPYAKSAGRSGKRGQIVDFSDPSLTPEGWTEDYLELDRKSMVVYETHVADVTSSTTWNGTEEYRKKFLGMIEPGTTYTQGNVTVTTGFDHIKELGVNAVQLIPIFDQDNDERNVTFNWGYNPLNYNVVEGAYSTNCDDGYVRIREFKQLVQAYKDAGIGIIMDVVYNHTSSNVGNNFDVLMPGYYYRYNANGTSSNGSGCGNDTASENYMFRKFMIDSACFWAKEYNLAGFRFDLMGLHDLDTMNQLVEALNEINPNIVVYGEPWKMGTATTAYLASQDNAERYYHGFGQFNDQGRDALIKGGMNANTAKGWITSSTANAGDVSKILAMFQGKTKSDSYTVTDPDKTVNYVTCHDNYTLYDRIKAAGITDETTIKQMAMLANSVVLTSNGTSFMLAGEEFLRTKGGDHNSYQSSYKVNELDYSLKIKHLDMFQNYQKLIWLKQNASGLCLEKLNMNANFTAVASSNNTVITLTFKGEIDGVERIIKVIHANGGVPAGTTTDLAGYTLYLDTLNINGLTLTNATPVAKYQTIIAYK